MPDLHIDDPAMSQWLDEAREWRANRADLSKREEMGDYPSSDDWHYSDDAGCALAERMLNMLITYPQPTTR